MKVDFEDKDLEELIACGKNNKYKKFSKDNRFMSNLVAAYNLLCGCDTIEELKLYSFLHYERLRHLSLSSIRIMNGRVARLLFKEEMDGIRITIIELNDNHYGNKK